MSLQDTGPRILLAVVVALLLFVLAFFVARGSSSDAALAPVREQPSAGSATLKHAQLRPIGAVPALPRAARKPKPKPTPRPTPPPVVVPQPPPPPVVVPRPPPPPPPSGCIGEGCGQR